MKELSIIKEVFVREKGDLILSDGGSETKRPVLREQLPLEVLHNWIHHSIYFASCLLVVPIPKEKQKILFHK